MHRTVLAAAALLLPLMPLLPLPAAAQEADPGTYGADSCRGEDRGFGTWSSSLSPRTVVAGEPATYTVVVRGPVYRAEVQLRLQQETTPEGPGGPYGEPAPGVQAQSGDAFPLTASESATFTLRTTPSLNGTASRSGAVYCGPGPFHGDAFGNDEQRLLVAPRLTLAARREAPRRYVFSGTASRPRQLLSLYRLEADGRAVLTAQTRAREDGTWSLRRTFLASGRFGLVLRTARDRASEPGTSAVRPTVVH